jgi:NAD(P)-dependent dehydrogenase (short-subunit alcohol dehydrogenase family)
MSSQLRVENRIAIVTGAGSGIGQASAIRLAEEGATVICADINGEAVNANVKQIIDYLKQKREYKLVPEIKRFSNN